MREKTNLGDLNTSALSLFLRNAGQQQASGVFRIRLKKPFYRGRLIFISIPAEFGKRVKNG